MSDRLFTPRFFLMCGFSFTVFFASLQLMPTAPFHILDLGGSTRVSGLFLGLLAYASAASSPLTGAYSDRLGYRRVLLWCSAALAGFAVAYGVIPSYRVMFGLALLHGVFWSAMLSSAAAYLLTLLPERRRAEGLGYYGIATVASIAVAPNVSFWVYRYGWFYVCLLAAILYVIMGVIAWQLDEVTPVQDAGAPNGPLVEWRVLVVSVSLFLYSFAYGGILSFSALYADASGVSPRALYLTILAIVMLISRPAAGRLADTVGYKRMFVPCLALIAVGLACYAVSPTRPWLIASALLFGLGFGVAYPVYVGYIMQHIDPGRRGAAFGGILGAFDTGIATGSTMMGWLIERYGFQAAFGTAAALSGLALPYFLAADRWFTNRTIDRRAHPLG